MDQTIYQVTMDDVNYANPSPSTFAILLNTGLFASIRRTASTSHVTKSIHNNAANLLMRREHQGLSIHIFPFFKIPGLSSSMFLVE